MKHAEDEIKLFTTCFFLRLQDAFNALTENDGKEFEDLTIGEIQQELDTAYQAIVDSKSEVINMAEYFEERLDQKVLFNFKAFDFIFLMEVTCKDIGRLKNDS